MYEIESDQI